VITIEQRAGAIANASGYAWSTAWRRTYAEALRHLREVDQTVRSHALSSGLEHAEWCRSQGKTAGDALVELGAPVPLLPTWADVTEAAARKAKAMNPVAR
jgi:hypothetical protein